MRNVLNATRRFREVAKAALTSCAIFLGVVLGAAPASATLFVFDQTSTTVPGLSVTASISVQDGDFSGIPTISTLIGSPTPTLPIDFGTLLAFDLRSLGPAFVTGDISQFYACVQCLGPYWLISPGGFINFGCCNTENYMIEGFGRDSTIQVDSDAGPCHEDSNPVCIVTGNWDPVPEPSTIWVLVMGLGLMGWMAGRRFSRGFSSALVSLASA
jgi:hypothetical protein